MSQRFKLVVIGLPALIAWAVGCSDREPTAANESAAAPLATAKGQAVTAQGRFGEAPGVIGPKVASPGAFNFDPPCCFASTFPLKGFYVHPKTLANFTKGNPGILDNTSPFGVTGYSLPNFLAWNCNLVGGNMDGTTPKLPAEIKFTDLVSGVSIGVASASGGTATLAAFNSLNVLVAFASVAVNSAMQPLHVSTTGLQIKRVKLTGPCIMVADDISITR